MTNCTYLSGDHLINHDTKSPVVNTDTVTLAKNDLRSDIIRGPAKGISFV
jgi:hypothetical protein